MKTLIVYGTKYGSAEKCAKEIAKHITGQVDVINLKNNKEVKITDYDKVIIGSSIYAGMLRKEVKAFYEANKEGLKHKKVAIFISCMDKVNPEQYITNNFDADFISQLIAKCFCGGEYQFSKMNFVERFMIKKITQAGAKKGQCEAADGKTDITDIQYKNIKTFAKQVNEA